MAARNPESTVTFAHCREVEKRCVGLSLRRADRVVSQIFDAALRKAGLKNTQFSLLVTVRAMQPVPLSCLADRIDLDRTTLTRNLQPLEAAGLISTSRGDDQRERILTLTDRGAAALAEAFPIWQATQARIEKRMGERAAHSLLTDLKKLSAALE